MILLVCRKMATPILLGGETLLLKSVLVPERRIQGNQQRSRVSIFLYLFHSQIQVAISTNLLNSGLGCVLSQTGNKNINKKEGVKWVRSRSKFPSTHTTSRIVLYFYCKIQIIIENSVFVIINNELIVYRKRASSFLPVNQT